MPPLDAARDFFIQLRKLGMHEAFAALPAAHQREYYQWISQAANATDRLARLEKLRSKLTT